jgi:hypothetical protein
MQHDDPRGIAVLLDRANLHALAFGAFTQPRQQGESFLLVPRKSMVRRDRVKDVEPRVTRASNAERPVKGMTAGLGEVDRAHDLLYRRHSYLRAEQVRCLPFQASLIVPSSMGS